MEFMVRTWVAMMVTAQDLGERVRRNERGQGAVEYILVLGVVALIVFALSQSTIKSQAQTAITNAVTSLFTAAN